MDDELEDKIFYQTYVSHMKILSKFALGGSGGGGIASFIPPVGASMAQLWRFLRVFLSRPEVLICGLVICLFMFYIQAVEVWTRGIVGRLQSGMGLRAFTKRVDTIGMLPSQSTVEKHSWEMLRDSSAVYSVRGRRANMEDRYILDQNINNNTGISLFAIFDGHGGEFAADFAKDILIQNLYNKIIDAHNIVTGKVPRPVATATAAGPAATAAAASSNESKEATAEAKKATVEERRNSFRKTTSFTEDCIGGKRNGGCNAQPPQPDIYKLNNLCRPLNKEDFLNGTVGGGGQDGGVGDAPAKIPQPQEAHCYIEKGGQINFGRMLTDEVLVADYKLVETVTKMTSYAGTTALIAVLQGSRLVVANVGDSRGVMCDSRGNAIPLSFDHKPQQVRERKRIHQAGGFIAYKGVWRVAGVLATSRALGDYPLKKRNLVIADPDILTFDLADHKPMFLIFASDGLWDTFSNEEAVAFIKERLTEPHFGAKSITLQSYVRGSMDNITVMVVVFDPKSGSFKIGTSE